MLGGHANKKTILLFYCFLFRNHSTRLQSLISMHYFYVISFVPLFIPRLVWQFWHSFKTKTPEQHTQWTLTYKFSLSPTYTWHCIQAYIAYWAPWWGNVPNVNVKSVRHSSSSAITRQWTSLGLHSFSFSRQSHIAALYRTMWPFS